MQRNKLALGFAGSLALAAATFAIAQPGVNISARRHPNLNEAQRYISGAVGKIDAAQRANEFDMNGHAQRAKDLLMQADAELKQAAITANHR